MALLPWRGFIRQDQVLCFSMKYITRHWSKSQAKVGKGPKATTHQGKGLKAHIKKWHGVGKVMIQEQKANAKKQHNLKAVN